MLATMNEQRRFVSTDVLVAVLAVSLVAAVGGALTRLDGWYFGLAQPWFKPPDWAFGPAWTLLFTLIAFSGVLAWRAGAVSSPSRRRAMLFWFSVNGLANITWSLLFFTLKRPDWALLEVPLLWLSIIAMMIHLWPYARKAAWLLLPYLGWVSLAALINLETVRLNAPF